MRIYLTQDGLAVPKEVDPNRPLSDEGRADVRRLADLLGDAGVRVGSMACLERDAGGQWVLLWMLRPDLLRTART